MAGYCSSCSILLLVTVDSRLLCLLYKFSFITGMYVQEKTSYIQGSVPPRVSSTPWGAWNVSPGDKGGLLWASLKDSAVYFNCVLTESLPVWTHNSWKSAVEVHNSSSGDVRFSFRFYQFWPHMFWYFVVRCLAWLHIIGDSTILLLFISSL